MQGLRQGQTLQNGKYRIEDMLGQGSFGITYLATAKLSIQGNLGSMLVETKVAVKEFFMRDFNTRLADGSSVDGSSGSVITNYRKKFKKEAENLSKLSHPNIVNVFDVFDENNTTYYVMEYLEGTNLDDCIKLKGSLSEAEAISVVKDIGGALAYMHLQKMLHLDIKPKNIMRKPDGTYYLIDFGLSKQYTEDGEPESSTSIGLGTPGYAPIEQASYKPEGTFPATLDVYALGATMFKMLTGVRPPEAVDIFDDGFPEDELSKSGVSSRLLAAVEKAMEPAKKKRYQSINDFIKGLESDYDDEVTELDSPEILFELGSKYYYGRGVPQDFTEAVKWYRMAAEKGSADAQYNLGVCYRNGRGVPQDYSEAVKWYRMAAEQGDADAQCFLGYCYKKEQGVLQDYTAAVKWYRKAAEQGNATAQYNLGGCYYEGEGVPQDYNEAVKWYRMAAEKGSASAQYNLGVCYRNGRGVPQDYSEAVKWYRMAAEQGDADAQEMLLRLSN